jgi:phage shock protein PspC (stress-responsive transcriptional regulator)
MQKVVSINLNGRAYHVEEPGYLALLAYLERAGTRLATDPDRAEILRDLEQAIAEKCDRGLGPNKTVVETAEITRILDEMGPVNADGPDETAGKTADGGGPREQKKAEPSPKRLYQIREGAMISGVCTGIAAYLDVDVTLVRIAFVIFALITRGAGLLVYGVLMFVIPYAETAEQRAAATGRPFTAQELVEQAKRNYADFKTNKDWNRHWRRQQREWHRRWRYATTPRTWNTPPAYASQVWTSATAPILGLINAALALTLVFALFSLARTQTVFGVPLPSGVPLWAGFLILIGIYQVIASPFIAAHSGAPGLAVWMAPINTVVWFAVCGVALWYGYHHVPAVHDAIQAVLTTFRGVEQGLLER